MNSIMASAVILAIAESKRPVSMGELVEKVQSSTDASSGEIKGKILSMIPQSVTLTTERKLILTKGD